MDKQNFQIIIYIIFGFFVIAGLGSLALFGFLKKDNSSPIQIGPKRPVRARTEILIWGTFDADKVDPILEILSESKAAERGYYVVRYEEKNPETVESEYVRAVAYDGRIPDLFLFGSDEIIDFEPLLLPISFGPYPITSSRSYRQIFIPAAEVLIRDPNQVYRQGSIIALPLLTDSLVLYYNENLRLRDNAPIPKLWSDFTAGAYPDLFEQYKNSNKAIIPLGAYRNYANAPYLFAALFLQTKAVNYAGVSVKDVLEFYTNFANPQSSAYTWSEIFPDARAMFSGGQLLFYPGFVSEYEDLRRTNPNIIVRMVQLPQLPAYFTKVVSGRNPRAVQTKPLVITPTKLYALGISEKGRLPGTAVRVVLDLARLVAETPEDIFNAVQLPPPVQEPITVEQHSVEKVIIDALPTSAHAPLSSERQTALLKHIENIVVGLRTPGQVENEIYDLFQEN